MSSDDMIRESYAGSVSGKGARLCEAGPIGWAARVSPRQSADESNAAQAPAFPFRWKILRRRGDTNVSWDGIVRQSTKKAVSIRRFGARVIGIVTGANSEEAAAWDALAQCDLAEFRADLFDPSRIPQAFRAFRAERDRRGLSFATILTIRLCRDGGAWPDAQAERRGEIWQALADGGPEAASEWFDLEIEEIPRLSPELRNAFARGGSSILLSHHDFTGCPSRERLRALLGDMLAQRPAGVKFAVTCLDRRETIALMAFAREAAAASPLASVLSMGGPGRAMRVLGPALGCPLAYGFLTGAAVAPGQLSARDLGRRLDDFSASLPGELLAPGAEPRLLDWAEARLQGVMLE
jgi:3-dehydroquinate dehydratase type I